MSTTFTIIEDDLTGEAILALIGMHQREAVEKSPPGTSYALDLSGLATPDITMFSAWRDGALAGCAALKAMGAGQAEIKSMRTAPAFLRQGVADAILDHLITIARDRQYHTLCLETGTNEDYAPAVALYCKHGFMPGPVYGGYKESPHNQFFWLTL